MSRKFGPKAADHPGIGKECPACHVPFAEGDYTTLVVLGPGDDEEARKRRDEGRFYKAGQARKQGRDQTAERLLPAYDRMLDRLDALKGLLNEAAREAHAYGLATDHGFTNHKPETFDTCTYYLCRDTRAALRADDE